MTEDRNDSRLTENILLFCRTLRSAGLATGPGQVIDAIVAIAKIGVERRQDFYYALRAVLVTDRSQFRMFDQAFHIYFRNPRLLERMMSLLLPTLEQDYETSPRGETIRRLMEALAEKVDVPDGKLSVEIDRSESWSDQEVLRQKDFEQMSLQELAEAKVLLQKDLALVHPVHTRRFRASHIGLRYDLRRSMQLMLRNSGQVIELAQKKPRLRAPTVVLLCDVSGSMSHYSRMFLQFAHTLSMRQQRVHSFVFGTRLTNISRRMVNRDVDTAMQKIASDVVDWDGGTRIADCLKRFNQDWGRRVLAGNSIVILLSDGLERDSKSDLGFQMRRLRRCCKQIVWMNPMLRYAEFEAKALGIRAMLPHVDKFIPAHNVNSLADMGRILQGDCRAPERAA